MKNTYLYFILLLLLILQHKSFGQSNFLHNINASGNNISGSTGMVTYSIGQVFFSYSENNSHYIGEGVQQGFLEDNTNNEDININNVNIEITVFPNPTTDIVTLASDGLEFNGQAHSYQLYNYQGKLLKKQPLRQRNTQIDLTNLSTSIYMLQVYVEEKLWKTFKILKQ